jgi:hypothetical protein
MNPQNLPDKAFQDKINAELHQFDTRLKEFEARDSARTAQAELDAINHLKAQRQKIEAKRHELRTVGDARIQQVKTEIDAELTRLKSSWAQLATKFKKAG